MLEYRGTTLQDVYDARTFIEAPCAALLAQRRTEQDLAHLTEAVARAEQLMDDPQAFIRAHMEFHASNIPTPAVGVGRVSAETSNAIALGICQTSPRKRRRTGCGAAIKLPAVYERRALSCSWR